MQQARLYISGFVQGVGYRQFVKLEARRLGLVGFVKNLPDGRVEAVIQGEKEKLELLIEKCYEGSFLSDVKEVTTIWEQKAASYTNFTIEKE